MNSGRRRFLGAIAGTAATVLLPRSAQAATVRGADTWLPWSMLPPESLAVGNVQGDVAPSLLSRALSALDTHSARITDRSVIGVVDFSAPSRTQRMHIVDLAGGRILSSHLVAHGRGSDPANSGWVEHLSNRVGSEASCSGSFVIGDTYHGKHGLSRRILGLDPENDQAEVRGIVIHAASYVGSDFLSEYGRIGRSQGCFAVSGSEIDTVLQQLGPGRLLFAAR